MSSPLRRYEREILAQTRKRRLHSYRVETPTFWNGEPAHAIRCVVAVGKPLAPTWWCAGLEGQRRRAVMVTYGGEDFFLDDEDGSGWAKVTVGHGSPRVGHRSLPHDSRVVLSDTRQEEAQ